MQGGGEMTLFSQYEGKIIRLTDDKGNPLTGTAVAFPAEYGMREYGMEEDGIRLGEHVVFRSRIRDIRILPTYEEAIASVPPGRYRHFKGNEYEVTAIARHSETEECMVVYKALYGNGETWVRPADMWNETVERNGKKYRRFYRADRIERVEKYERLLCDSQPEGRSSEEHYSRSNRCRPCS